MRFVGDGKDWHEKGLRTMDDIEPDAFVKMTIVSAVLLVLTLLGYGVYSLVCYLF
jgi:hypothetical protein